MSAKEVSKTPRKPKPTTRPAAKATKTGPAAKSSKLAKGGKTDESPAKKGSGQKPMVKKDAARSALRTPPARPGFVPRAVANIDDDDVLMAHGGGGGGFGRCGGRSLASRTEQQLCHRLGIAGVVHSHSPRHYEVRYTEGRVAAYAPMIVLRGRGREGKSVVIEAVEEADAPILRKVSAFRSQYGQEFYVILVAPDDLVDDVPLAALDESCSSTNVNTLIARLAE